MENSISSRLPTADGIILVQDTCLHSSVKTFWKLWVFYVLMLLEVIEGSLRYKMIDPHEYIFSVRTKSPSAARDRA